MTLLCNALNTNCCFDSFPVSLFINDALNMLSHITTRKLYADDGSKLNRYNETIVNINLNSNRLGFDFLTGVLNGSSQFNSKMSCNAMP